jgi:hypothetical protein
MQPQFTIQSPLQSPEILGALGGESQMVVSLEEGLDRVGISGIFDRTCY